MLAPFRYAKLASVWVATERKVMAELIAILRRILKFRVRSELTSRPVSPTGLAVQPFHLFVTAINSLINLRQDQRKTQIRKPDDLSVLPRLGVV